MGADTIWQPVMDGRDLDVGFQDPKAALDICQCLIPPYSPNADFLVRLPVLKA
jgi:hypothetical protein